MNLSNPDTEPKRIDDEATHWAMRLEDRSLTREEQAQFEQWLAADSRHSGALLRARAAWVDLDRLAALRGKDSASSSPARMEDSLFRFSSERKRDGMSRRWLVAAGLAVVVLGSPAAWWSVIHRNVYVSDIGEVRRVALSDGSRMVLNTATEARVHFDKTRREIDLAKGEGLFQVAKDPGRPFVVDAGRISVLAVGTVFSVRALNSQVDVTVTEGVVELIDNSAGTVIQRVAANEHATVLDRRQVEVQPIAHDEAERRLAWRDGMVDFAGETLSQAVNEINRHNNRQVVIDDPALAARPVVGLFRANDPDGFAETVAMALGVQHVDQEDEIHLRPK